MAISGFTLRYSVPPVARETALALLFSLLLTPLVSLLLSATAVVLLQPARNTILVISANAIAETNLFFILFILLYIKNFFGERGPLICFTLKEYGRVSGKTGWEKNFLIIIPIVIVIIVPVVGLAVVQISI